jgi:UDP-N-acetylglucosamine acyltransferase
MPIHPTAIVDSKAEIDSTADIGPYVIIEGPVRIGAGTRVRSHAHLSGWTRIGERCDIHPFAVIGHLPQDFHHGGERSYCTIGNDVVIREGSTVHRGTQAESETIIGDGCFLLCYAHIAHNCRLGRGVKVYPYCAVAGHVEVGDDAILSGGVLIHQFVRIGSLAFAAAGAMIGMDVPPFLTVCDRNWVIQHNVVGMRRAGYSREEILEIRQAFRTLYRSGLTFRKAAERLGPAVQTRAGRMLLDFISVESQRGYCPGGARRGDHRPAGSSVPE